MLFTEKDMIAFKSFEGSISDFKDKMLQKRTGDDRIRLIANIVADMTDTSIYDMNANTRVPQSVFPRQLAHWGCYYYTREPLHDVGRIIGNKHYATINHSVKVVETLASTYDKNAMFLSKLEDRLRANGLRRIFNRGEIRSSQVVTSY